MVQLAHIQIIFQLKCIRFHVARIRNTRYHCHFSLSLSVLTKTILIKIDNMVQALLSVVWSVRYVVYCLWVYAIRTILVINDDFKMIFKIFLIKLAISEHCTLAHWNTNKHFIMWMLKSSALLKFLVPKNWMKIKIICERALQL